MKPAELEKNNRNQSRKRKLLLNELSKGILVTLALFVVVELALRVAYSLRNSMVTYIPLPYGYVINDYGPFHLVWMTSEFS